MKTRASAICLVRHREYGELMLRREAEVLRDAGYDVHVVCLGEGGRGGYRLDDGVHIHALPLARERGSVLRYVFDYASFLVAVFVLLTWLQLRHRFRVVQVSTMPDFLVFCTIPAKVLGARVIAFMKEPTPELGLVKFGNPVVPRVLAVIEQAAIRYADLAITVTEQLRQRYIDRGADAEKICVVLNGAGSDSFPAPGAPPAPALDAFTLLCHGAIVPRYGHDVVIRAVALAAEAVPGLRFRITGEGSSGPDLLQLADELGIADRVDLLGWLTLPELVGEIQACDVGVVAQLSSPYSNLVHTNKMYEYMLFGKPVIASRLDSVSAYFDDESVAFFEPGDAEDLAAVIIELAHDPVRRRRLCEGAARLYRDYGWERQAQVYLSAVAEAAA